MNPSLLLASLAMASVGDNELDFVVNKLHNPGFELPKGPKYRESSNRTPKIKGNDRNAPCACGSGKKTKKCGCGGVGIKKAHTLEEAQYVAEVEKLAKEQLGEEIAAEIMSRYTESHIKSYWRDEMITPARCLDLVYEMLGYEEAL